MNYQNYSQLQLIQQQNKHLQEITDIIENHQNVDKTYQNVHYLDNIDHKTLVIDVPIGKNTTFSVDLIEPLIIDKKCHVLLDYFLTSHCIGNKQNTHFLVEIDQFNKHSKSNNETVRDKFVIPNESSHLNLNNDAFRMVIHKAKKQNYICTLQPKKIYKISGTIVNDGQEQIIQDPENIENFSSSNYWQKIP